MGKRSISIIAGVVILILVVLGAGFLMQKSPEKSRRSVSEKFARVPVTVAIPGEVTAQIHFTGRIVAEEQIDMQSEVGGRLLSLDPSFKTGHRFEKGEIILSIDDRETRQLLRAARYRFAALLSRLLPDISIDYPDQYEDWEIYLEQIDASRPLPQLPEFDNRQFQLFLVGKNVYSEYYNIKQQETRLEKFTIEAPFTGVVTESRADPGDIIQPNRSVGVFTKLDPLEIEASIPASLASDVKVGKRVQLRLDQNPTEEFSVTVVRKNARIDPTTQSVAVFMRIAGSGLKPGAYVEGTMQGKTYSDAAKIPLEALVRDREVFVIRDSTATLTTIEPVAQTGDSLIIRGFPPGSAIINNFHNADYEGTPVLPVEPSPPR